MTSIDTIKALTEVVENEYDLQSVQPIAVSDIK